MSGMNEFMPEQNEKYMKEHTTSNNHEESKNDENEVLLGGNLSAFESNLLNVTQSLSTMLSQIEQLKTEVAVLKQQKKELDEYKEKQRKDMDTLELFLTDEKYNVNLMEYYDIFKEQGFEDMDILKELTDDGLQEIGIIKLAHRMKILRGIKILKSNS